MDLLINIKTAKSLGHYPNPRCLPRLPSRLDSLEGISPSQVSSTAPVHLFNSHLRMQPRDWLRSRVPVGSAHGTCPNSADALRIVVRPFDWTRWTHAAKTQYVCWILRGCLTNPARLKLSSVAPMIGSLAAFSTENRARWWRGVRQRPTSRRDRGVLRTLRRRGHRARRGASVQGLYRRCAGLQRVQSAHLGPLQPERRGARPAVAPE